MPEPLPLCATERGAKTHERSEHEREPSAGPASRDILRDHEYDGIREYDNPTPGWWSMIFVATFLFSIWYFLFYHMSTISTSVGAGYDQAVSADMKRRFAEIASSSPTRRPS